MHELALFAGAGGGLLASQHLLGWRTVCYVERNEYCVEVLKARMRDGLLDRAPIWDDVRTFDGQPWRGCVDIITAGFPCQPYSGAGKGLGEKDERNLWPDTYRIITEVTPRFVLLENVARLLCYAYFGQILADLAACGFGVRWDCVPACAVGAPHRRDRLWVLAYADRGRFEESADVRASEAGVSRGSDLDRGGEGKGDVANANSNEQDGWRGFVQVGREWGTEAAEANSFAYRVEWAPEPGVGRMAYGVAHRVDRLAALGEGQVPAVVRAVWRILGKGGIA